MSVYEALVDLIGTPPAGLEPLIWVIAAVTFLYLVRCTFGIIASLLDWIGGRR